LLTYGERCSAEGSNRAVNGKGGIATPAPAHRAIRINRDLEGLPVPKIWFRKDKNAYYLQVDRKRQKRLGRTKAEAEIALYPVGPLFRSTRKFGGIRRPWTRNGIRCRFKRLREKFLALREKLPSERKHEIPDLTSLTSYVLRHTFTTQALLNGVPVPAVSALLGHKSIKMVDEHFNHTDQVTDQLKEAVKKATGSA
jgi:integrase